MPQPMIGIAARKYDRGDFHLVREITAMPIGPTGNNAIAFRNKYSAALMG